MANHPLLYLADLRLCEFCNSFNVVGLARLPLLSGSLRRQLYCILANAANHRANLADELSILMTQRTASLAMPRHPVSWRAWCCEPCRKPRSRLCREELVWE